MRPGRARPKSPMPRRLTRRRDNPHDAVRVAVSMPAFSAEVCARAHTRTHAHARTHTHARTRTRTHLYICPRTYTANAPRTLLRPRAHPTKQAPPPREVFLVRRREEGGVPAELLEALARVARVISAAEAAHDAGGDAAAVAAAAAAAMATLEGKEAGEEAGEGEGEGEEAIEDVEVGAEEVTSLIEILQGRLEPLRKTGKADRKLLRQPAGNKAVEAAGSEDVSSRRREYLAMYREGLRGVLQEAVESLQEMLLGAMAESEGEDEQDGQ